MAARHVGIAKDSPPGGLASGLIYQAWFFVPMLACDRYWRALCTMGHDSQGRAARMPGNGWSPVGTVLDSTTPASWGAVSGSPALPCRAQWPMLCFAQ